MLRGVGIIVGVGQSCCDVLQSRAPIRSLGGGGAVTSQLETSEGEYVRHSRVDQVRNVLRADLEDLKDSVLGVPKRAQSIRSSRQSSFGIEVWTSTGESYESVS